MIPTQTQLYTQSAKFLAINESLNSKKFHSLSKWNLYLGFEEFEA